MEISPDDQNIIVQHSLETDYSTQPIYRRFHRLFWYIGFVIIGIMLSTILYGFFINQPPKKFPESSIITIYQGMSSRDLAQILAEQQIIKSPKVFYGLLLTKYRNDKIIAGDYSFDTPISTKKIINRFVRGSFGNVRFRVTFPEGITRFEMADIFSQVSPEFPRDEFLQKTYTKEGFLFPDTYFFFTTQSIDTILQIMEDQFIKNIEKLSTDFVQPINLDTVTVKKFGGKIRTVREIIIMASILEREASNAQEAKTIAGILWKRIKNNMPLQVDATFGYTIGKTSRQLSLKDLQKDNPYNTYTRIGLPIGPIGNPGFAMIDATLNPIDSPYWYYLHGDDGIVRYAKTHDEHVANKRKYIKN